MFPTITIIFSIHQNLGKANSDELYNIIEGIKPDVIFEEIPQSSYHFRYVLRRYRSLENIAIDNYIQMHNIPHIGVDMEDIPKDEYFSEDYRNLYNKIERLNDHNSIILKESMEEINKSTTEDGFYFLNSSKSSELYSKVGLALDDGIRKLNNPNANKIIKEWHNITDHRENEMINNIYEYAQQNEFNQAVFTIGAYHCNSLLNKIEQYQKKVNNTLTWNLHNRDDVMITK